MRYVVGLSGGKDSTVLALELKRREPHVDWEYICTPTGNELPPVIEFVICNHSGEFQRDKQLALDAGRV